MTCQTPSKQEMEPETLDALCGAFKIYQYKKGHRFSTDDLLVAWFGTAHSPSAQSILDLGTGCGTVGMIAAWKVPGARIVGVEAQERSVQLCQKSLELNNLSERFDLRHGDLRDPSLFLNEEQFDLILGSPPYFPVSDGIVSTNPQKAACRFELRGNIFDYCLTAGRRLKSEGVFACIFPISPPHQLARLLEALRCSRLRLLRRRDVILKEGHCPLLGLFLVAKDFDLEHKFQRLVQIDPPLVIRTRDGRIHPEYRWVKQAIGVELS